MAESCKESVAEKNYVTNVTIPEWEISYDQAAERAPIRSTFAEALCDGSACSSYRSGEILSVRFEPEITGDYPFRIRFIS